MADLPARRGGGMLGAPRGWDPFERMQELLGFDLGRMLGPQGTREGGFVPDFEVKETQDAFIFKADVPGVEEKDLEITLAENRLTISGKREEERRDESDRYYAYERNYGSFSRTFTLPRGVNADDVQADFKSGVLNVRIPKKSEEQPKRIKVGGGERSDKAKA
ncbi:Hsp20/alpha crystallin family protein [Myxococcus virescens]|uniref:Heat-shock protein Hsp20 n=2 Tax=Myxococcus virescens TaxID=83456 RepID=A0A511H4S2_9BACT|nr:Hsp20/alpha crystallin family protein [Myxococcus virescens]GEL68521.1 heat-shock protein Hsp20 [Myxococcus virescens]